MTQPDIQEMSTPGDVAIVRTLVQRYVQWLFESFPDEVEDLSSYYSDERVRQALEDVAAGFIPPHGIALIARTAEGPVGCVLAHQIASGIAEMKRLFVVPSARGKGIGRALISALIARMDASGHPTIRLDTAVFLKDAIALYRRMGFVEIPPYMDMLPGTEMTALFFERRANIPSADR